MRLIWDDRARKYCSPLRKTSVHKLSREIPVRNDTNWPVLVKYLTDRPEKAMQNRPRACSPEMLASLQRVVNAIWLELELEHSRHMFPWNVQAEEDESR